MSGERQIPNSPQLGGISGPLYGIGPANWDDAEETRPLGATFDIGGHGSSTPYANGILAMTIKHMEEIRNKTASSMNMANNWKKRFRDFLALKNKDLLDFLHVSVPSHPVFGPAELLLRRFGNPSVTPSHPSVRDFVMDASGVDITPTIIEEMNRKNEEAGAGLQGYIAKTRYLYDTYRAAGDELLSVQEALKRKLDKLDRVQARITPLLEIEQNDMYNGLMEVPEQYMKEVFEGSQIREEYKALIEAYRKFVAVRDIVTLSRTVVSHESEPVCGICLQDPVLFTITPCGHTYCQNCIKRQVANCFMCRGAIKEKVRLYFG